MGKKGENSDPIITYPSTRTPGRYTLRLLFTRWRASLYKLVWRNVLGWLTLYYILFFSYHFAMSDDQKLLYQNVCQYCESKSGIFQMSMILGSYVKLVIDRWWVSWDNLPWPDEYLFFVGHCVRGEDEDMRVIRRTLARYWNLAYVYCLTLISPRVRMRFPTLAHFIEAGLMTENEMNIIKHLRESTEEKLYYIPIQWSAMLLTQLTVEGHMSLFQLRKIMDALIKLRGKCANSLMIEVQNIPLIFPQVATWGVYLYSGAALLGYQFAHLEGEEGPFRLYFPFMGVIEVIFFFGWLKVSENLIDPYGNDDDDLPLNLFIDGNIQESYMMMDKALAKENAPAIMKDIYWELVVPAGLPHTAESAKAEAKKEQKDYEGSLFDLPDSAAAMAEQEAILEQVRRKRTTVKRMLSTLTGHPQPRMTTRRPPRKETQEMGRDVTAGHFQVNDSQAGFRGKGYVGDKIYTVPPRKNNPDESSEDERGEPLLMFGLNPKDETSAEWLRRKLEGLDDGDDDIQIDRGAARSPTLSARQNGGDGGGQMHQRRANVNRVQRNNDDGEDDGAA